MIHVNGCTDDARIEKSNGGRGRRWGETTQKLTSRSYYDPLGLENKGMKVTRDLELGLPSKDGVILDLLSKLGR